MLAVLVVLVVMLVVMLGALADVAGVAGGGVTDGGGSGVTDVNAVSA